MRQMSEQPIAGGSHYCSACGQVHGGQDQAAEVAIAKINADRDVRVAEIQRAEVRHAATLGAETQIAVAEISAAAGVEETAALAEGIAEAADAGAVEAPVITDVPVPDAEPEVQSITERDEDDGDDMPPPAETRSRLRYWP
jgi:hypothetical protein